MFYKTICCMRRPLSTGHLTPLGDTPLLLSVWPQHVLLTVWSWVQPTTLQISINLYFLLVVFLYLCICIIVQFEPYFYNLKWRFLLWTQKSCPVLINNYNSCHYVDRLESKSIWTISCFYLGLKKVDWKVAKARPPGCGWSWWVCLTGLYLLVLTRP